MRPAVFEAADVRTLALARPILTEDLLDRYVAYQRSMVELLPTHPGDLRAVAHRLALERGGLPANQHPAIEAVCRDFAGKHATARRLRRRIEEVTHPGDLGRRADLETQLERLTEPTYWAARYGAEALRLLEARECPLVELHLALQRLELPYPLGPE